MSYSVVSCSKCQRPCWDIAYIRFLPVCNECLMWFEIGRPAVTPSGRCYW